MRPEHFKAHQHAMLASVRASKSCDEKTEACCALISSALEVKRNPLLADMPLPAKNDPNYPKAIEENSVRATHRNAYATVLGIFLGGDL